MYWNSFFHKSTRTLLVIAGLFLLRLLLKQQELTQILAANVSPVPAPFLLFLCTDSPTLLSSCFWDSLHALPKSPVHWGTHSWQLTSPGNSLRVFKDLQMTRGEELCGLLLSYPTGLVLAVDGGKSVNLVGANLTVLFWPSIFPFSSKYRTSPHTGGWNRTS